MYNVDDTKKKSVETATGTGMKSASEAVAAESVNLHLEALERNWRSG